MKRARPGLRLLAVAAVIALALAGAGAALAWEGYQDARSSALEELGFTAGIAWLDRAARVRAAAGTAEPAPSPERRLAAALVRVRSSGEPFVSEAVPPSVFASPAVVVAVPTRTRPDG